MPSHSTPQLMGILNLGPDSFSGDGVQSSQAILSKLQELQRHGADLIDVGAESARTNRAAITIKEEIEIYQRFFPVWEKFKSCSQQQDSLPLPQLSINTWRLPVIQACLDSIRIDLINDMSGLQNPEETNTRLTLCRDHHAKLLIMHTVGEPKIPHPQERYTSVWQTMLDFFQERITLAAELGLPKDQLILDPGIDFAKSGRDNLLIYQQLDKLHALGCPILLPISRKTIIGEVLDQPDPKERDPGTMACLIAGYQRGVTYFRVHNVKAARQTLLTAQAVATRSSINHPRS